MPTSALKVKLCVSSLAIVTLFCVSLLEATDQQDPAGQQQSADIKQLIERLGSPQFATRERAQAKIQSLGLSVFDALLEAQDHRDIEVARRARYLLRGMPVEWSVDTDPQEVRSVLRNYGEQGRVERLSRIEHLANLDDSLGTAALCRIMRFEANVVLSKQAAIQLMSHQVSVDAKDRLKIADRIRESVGNSRRPAARWLRTYADSLVSLEPTLEEWERITRDELETWTKMPDQTQRSVVRDLLRWHVDQLRDLQRTEDVRANILRIVELVEPERKELFDVVDWALERDAWFVPALLADRFPAEYWQHAMLVYRLAEAKRHSGDEAGAGETAKLALAMNPGQLGLHLNNARMLYSQRQMFDWSEAEFRQTIAASGDSPRAEVFGRELLAEMLADLQRDKDAAKVLEPSIAIAENDPTTLAAAYEILRRTPPSPTVLRGRIQYMLGNHYGRVGDIDQQKDVLRKAITNDPENIDIVIAIYHVADDTQAWRDEAERLLEEHVQRIASRLKELEQDLAKNKDRDMRRLVSEDVEEFAQKNNEYAWLVSNTAGDYQKALACSQRSLELVPGSWAYQDTLGRCYYAVGDYKNAIRYQKLAVAQVPYMQQMRRQLKLFEDSLAQTAAEED